MIETINNLVGYQRKISLMNCFFVFLAKEFNWKKIPRSLFKSNVFCSCTFEGKTYVASARRRFYVLCTSSSCVLDRFLYVKTGLETLRTIVKYSSSSKRKRNHDRENVICFVFLFKSVRQLSLVEKHVDFKILFQLADTMGLLQHHDTIT